MKNIYIAIPVLVGSLLMVGCVTSEGTYDSSVSDSVSPSYDTSTQDMLNAQAAFDQTQNMINTQNMIDTQNMVNSMNATAAQNNP